LLINNFEFGFSPPSDSNRLTVINHNVRNLKYHIMRGSCSYY